jgi:hypothetical protein
MTGNSDFIPIESALAKLFFEGFWPKSLHHGFEGLD